MLRKWELNWSSAAADIYLHAASSASELGTGFEPSFSRHLPAYRSVSLADAKEIEVICHGGGRVG